MAEQADGIVFSEDGTRNTKSNRLSALSADVFEDSFLRNTVKEELILEYAEHFRAQYVQLYPERSPLLLAPSNEAQVPKFVCTTLRPTQPPVKELYDLAACAKFVASHVKFEPLDPQTELPEQIPSPLTTLQTRAGDSFDLSILLASFLIGNGYDAYVVVGTAPKWVTLKNESMSRCDFTSPADAVDREVHTSPATLGLLAAKAASAEPAGTNKYRLPPPASLDSDFSKTQSKKAEVRESASVTADSWVSDDEGSGDELQRLRSERPKPASSSSAARKRSAMRGRVKLTASDVDDAASEHTADPLHGQRVHAWVLVREGRREVTSHMFVEASTGVSYSVTSGAPYLSVESVFNHKNYWVNMQCQPLIPNQSLTNGSALADGLRAALSSRSGGIRGSGGAIAAGAITSTLAGDRGADLTAALASRPEMLSPYMAALAALKEVQAAEMAEIKKRRGKNEEKQEAEAKDEDPLPPGQHYPTGAPILGGAAAAYTLANPRPPKPVAAPVPAAVKRREEPAPSDNGGDAGAASSGETGEAAGSSSESSDGGALPSPAAAAGEPGTPSAAAAAQSGYGGGLGSKPGSASSSLRPSQSRPGTRSRSQQASRKGARPWREVLTGAALSMQEALASIVKSEVARLPTVAELRWDFTNSDDWEYMLIPYEDEHAGDKDGEEQELGVASAGDGAGGKDAPSSSSSESKEGSGSGDVGSPRPDGGSNSLPSSRPGSAAVRAQSGRASGGRVKKDKYAGLKVEVDGEHVLDLPPSWCPSLTLDKHDVKESMEPNLGISTTHFKARLERWPIHGHPLCMVARHTSYEDSARLMVKAVTEVFSRRKDGLFKRVRRVGGAAQVVEEHFERGKTGGLAMIIEELGVKRESYFYAGARIDGLLLRREIMGRKVEEFYSPAALNRLWYRSITLAAPRLGPGQSASSSSSSSVPSSAATGVRPGSGLVQPVATLTIEVEHKTEAPIRKMAEKYRRDPSGATPAHADLDKVVYNLAEQTITARYHTPAGRIARSTRLFRKSDGHMEQVTVDPTAPTPRPFDIDQDFRRMCAMEKDCHAAARSAAKMVIEMVVQARAWEVRHVESETTVFEVAIERARSGAPLEEETERKSGGWAMMLRVCVSALGLMVMWRALRLSMLRKRCWYRDRCGVVVVPCRHPAAVTCTRFVDSCPAADQHRPCLISPPTFHHHNRCRHCLQTTWTASRTTCCRSCSPPRRSTPATRQRKRRGRQTGTAGQRTGSACWSAWRSSSGGWMRRTTSCSGGSRRSAAAATTGRTWSGSSRPSCPRPPSGFPSWSRGWSGRRRSCPASSRRWSGGCSPTPDWRCFMTRSRTRSAWSRWGCELAGARA